MFLSRNKKNNVYPCKLQFYYIKVGFKGSTLYRQVFMMSILLKCHNVYFCGKTGKKYLEVSLLTLDKLFFFFFYFFFHQPNNINIFLLFHKNIHCRCSLEVPQ